MRLRSGIIGACILLVILCFSGCEQLETNTETVTVNVMAAVYVRFVDEENHEVSMSADGVTVSIEMAKQDQNRLVFSRIVQQGLCQATGSYTMNTGESITCTATIENSFMGYTTVSPVTAQLLWSTVSASANFGSMYHWYPELTITMKKGSGG